MLFDIFYVAWEEPVTSFMWQSSTISMIYCRKCAHYRHTYVSTFEHTALLVQNLRYKAPSPQSRILLLSTSYPSVSLITIVQIYPGTWQRYSDTSSLQPATLLCFELLTVCKQAQCLCGKKKK